MVNVAHDDDHGRAGNVCTRGCTRLCLVF
jgi:hypothetical protein